MEALGYALSLRVVDAADHGVPQRRRRLFVIRSRSKAPLELRLSAREHIGAHTFIDFAAGKWSDIDRLGRSAATLGRVAAGRARFGERFLMPYYGSGSGLTGRCLSRPLGTVTTVDRWAVVNGSRMRMLTTPENRDAMGFPTTYKLPAQHRQAVHMLGNAVCPPVAADVITGGSMRGRRHCRYFVDRPSLQALPAGPEVCEAMRRVENYGCPL